jgi:hypothetical protein
MNAFMHPSPRTVEPRQYLTPAREAMAGAVQLAVTKVRTLTRG